MKSSPFSSLAAVQQRKAELNERIRRIEEEMAMDYATLFTPPPPSYNKIETFVNSASRVWMMVDGVMMGYKLMRRLGKVTTWFSKRK